MLMVPLLSLFEQVEFQQISSNRSISFNFYIKEHAHWLLFFFFFVQNTRYRKNFNVLQNYPITIKFLFCRKEENFSLGALDLGFPLTEKNEIIEIGLRTFLSRMNVSSIK